jgi:hypothetical protein
MAKHSIAKPTGHSGMMMKLAIQVQVLPLPRILSCQTAKYNHICFGRVRKRESHLVSPKSATTQNLRLRFLESKYVDRFRGRFAHILE